MCRQLLVEHICARLRAEGGDTKRDRCGPGPREARCCWQTGTAMRMWGSKCRCHQTGTEPELWETWREGHVSSGPGGLARWDRRWEGACDRGGDLEAGRDPVR